MSNEIKPYITYDCNMIHKKPLAEIELLLRHLSPHANKVETKNRQSLNYIAGGQHHCFLLHKGSVTLYRNIDGMVLNSESAPYLFGISTQLLEADYLYIRTQESSEVSVISIEEANKIIAKEDLWQSLSTLLIYTATRVYDHCTKISSLSSYEIICYQLFELMGEPEEIRNSVSIVSYIKSRTFLSRSSIMKILAQLKTGNYIVTDKGLLKAINNIPSRY
ncbi:helix-turn-helix domain-containing protein [Serratia fonticola]|uniref:winged helix-turn-helix transcriptional regulator n=1 Tax=Serratia fonticola TaxID=47917 RepID=UPI003AAE5814